MNPPPLPALIDALSAAGRAVFAEQATLHTVPEGAQVLHRGARAAGAYIVLGGRLRIYVIGPTGAEATLYTLDAGETCVLALNSLFQGLRYPAWVVAEVPCRVAVVPGPAFRQLFATEAAIRDLTVQALSTAVFQLMTELEQVHFQRLDHRLVNLLLIRAPSDGVLRMTQQQIADHLGASREAVARELRRLATAGCIETRRGAIELIEDGRLADMLAGNDAF